MLSNRLLSIFHLQSLFKSCCRPAIPLQRAQTAVNNRSPTPQTRHVQPIRALQANAAQRVRPPSSPLFFSSRFDRVVCRSREMQRGCELKVDRTSPLQILHLFQTMILTISDFFVYFEQAFRDKRTAFFQGPGTLARSENRVSECREGKNAYDVVFFASSIEVNVVFSIPCCGTFLRAFRCRKKLVLHVFWPWFFLLDFEMADPPFPSQRCRRPVNSVAFLSCCCFLRSCF